MSDPASSHLADGGQYFPDRPQFSGFMKPCRFEGDVQNLEVHGKIPADIDGTFYRVMPDPQFDPKTGDMICFGYEARGDGAPDICYYNVTLEWRVTEVVWLVALVLFPLIPQLYDIERMKRGGEHWEWSPETPFYIGLLPQRGAKPADVKWFRYRNSFPGHTANAYETKDGQIIFDLGLSDQNVFFRWPDAQVRAPEPHQIHSQLTRFTVDPSSDSLDLSEPEILQTNNTEFYRIDDRFTTQPYRHCFFDLMDPSLRTDFAAIAPRLGGGYPLYNALRHLDLETGETEIYFPGKMHMMQEPVFIPRAGSGSTTEGEEGDGYLLALVNNYATMCSELHLLDVKKDFTRLEAVILLPVRLRLGLHGNWVHGRGFENFRSLNVTKIPA
ncbi:hypothetical protein VTN00DRAFT_3601 [Thermoascus crustaceus]|uniref:uncharacterized protein n=1 Tax=Thermoascus crustaceus TaxID=5088 RepID=UPI0037429988